MNKVILKKGGKLILVEGKSKRNVTDLPFSFLFEKCELEEGLTLKDIFKLLNRDLKMWQIILRNNVEEVVKEGLTKKSKKAKDIEYLELYWHLHAEDYEENCELDDFLFPYFHAMSPLTKSTQYDELGNCIQKQGERIAISVSLTPINELVNYPVKLSNILGFSSYIDNKYKCTDYNTSSYTLGDILYGILWELSWHGTSKDKAQIKESLLSVMKEIDKDYGKTKN